MTTSRRASRYNFAVPVRSGTLLYNARTGSLVRLAGTDGALLAAMLASPDVPEVEEENIPPAVLAGLEKGGFVLTNSVDELAAIRDRFAAARADAPIVVTITVTQDCNLRCFYCYEDRSGDRLVDADIDAIVSRIQEAARRSTRKAMHVDWYGGEPMLNVDFIERASQALQSFAANAGLRYDASIISNGTEWPHDALGFVQRHQIREVQISFDGDAETHDRNRAYRRSFDRGESSFERAVEVVDAIHHHCKVAVRLNLDSRTAARADAFVNFARDRGWFAPPSRAVLQPARLAAFSARTSFMQPKQLSVTEFEVLKRQLARGAAAGVRIEEAETIDGFPRPKTSVCAALGSASFVVGADLKEYRCGLQVGETHRAARHIRRPRHILPMITDNTGADNAFWDTFDPTQREQCSKCSFLPVCWGGCPKRHLEQDLHAIHEQGTYWRENMARLIASGAGEEPTSAEPMSTAEQFRRE